MKNNRTISSLLLVLVICTCSFAYESYIESFMDMDYCDTKKTTGGWKTDDEIAFVRSKPPYESSVGWVNDPSGTPKKIAILGETAICAAGSGIFEVNVYSGANTSYPFVGVNFVDIAIDGGYAFCANELTPGGLKSIDLTTHTIPAGGSVSWATPGYGVAIFNGFAYVTAGSEGLKKVDISDPTSLSVPSSVVWAGNNARGIAIYRNFALVADASGLAIIDLTPATPTVVYTTTAEINFQAYGISVSGNTAALAAGDSIYVLDISEIGDGDADYTPVVLNRLGSMNNAQECLLYKKIIYAADATKGISMYNCDNPLKTWLKTNIPISSSAAGGASTSDIVVAGTLLLASADNDGIQFINAGSLKDPLPNVWTHTLPGIGGVGQIIFRDDKIYAISQLADGGFYVVDAVTFTPLGRTTAITGLISFDVSGNKAFVSHDNAGAGRISIIDFSNPASMIISTLLNSASYIYAIKLSGGFGYIATENAVHKINLSTGAILNTYNAAGQIFVSLLCDGSYVYAGTQTGAGLYKLNAADLSFVDNFPTPREVWDIYKRGNYIYVAANRDGLYKLDATTLDPAGWAINPIPTTSFSNGQPASLAFFGEYLLVGFYEKEDNDLYILNSSTGAYIGECPGGTWFINSIQTFGDMVYVSDYSNGIRAWEIGENKPDTSDLNTVLHSTKVNTSDFHYISFKSTNYWDHSDDDSPAGRSDTVFYEMLYTPVLGNQDTIVIVDEREDPPPDIFGNPTFYALPLCNDLQWRATVRQHREEAFTNAVDITPPPAAPADTLWRATNVTLRYSLDGLFRRAAHTTPAEGSEITVMFDTLATADAILDAYDILTAPDATVYIEYDGNFFSTLALPFNMILPKLILHIERATSLDFGDGENVEFFFGGTEIHGDHYFDVGAYEFFAVPRAFTYVQYRIKRGWNMISNMCTAPIDASDWGTIIYEYDGTGYVATDTLYPSKGYFLAGDDEIFRVQGITAQKASLVLTRGWNLIGGIATTIPASELSTHPERSLVPYSIFTMHSNINAYEVADFIEPQHAYWVFAVRPCTLELAPELLHRSFVAKNAMRENTEQFTIDALTSKTAVKLYCAYSNECDEKFNLWHDIPIMPPLPDVNCNIAFLRSGEGFHLSKDVRLRGEPFELVLNEDCDITVRNIDGNNALLTTTEQSMNLTSGEKAHLQAGTYMLQASAAETARPTRTYIERAYPNPFNAALALDVALADETAQVMIFDVTGRTVKTYALSGSGFHRLIWNPAEDEIRSGIFFAKLTSAHANTDPMKLIFVK